MRIGGAEIGETTLDCDKLALVAKPELLGWLCTVLYWGEWPSGLYSLRQVTEVKLGRVRSDAGWVTTET